MNRIAFQLITLCLLFTAVAVWAGEFDDLTTAADVNVRAATLKAAAENTRNTRNPGLRLQAALAYGRLRQYAQAKALLNADFPELPTGVNASALAVQFTARATPMLLDAVSASLSDADKGLATAGASEDLAKALTAFYGKRDNAASARAILTTLGAVEIIASMQPLALTLTRHPDVDVRDLAWTVIRQRVVTATPTTLDAVIADIHSPTRRDVALGTLRVFSVNQAAAVKDRSEASFDAVAKNGGATLDERVGAVDGYGEFCDLTGQRRATIVDWGTAILLREAPLHKPVGRVWLLRYGSEAHASYQEGLRALIRDDASLARNDVQTTIGALQKPDQATLDELALGLADPKRADTSLALLTTLAARDTAGCRKSVETIFDKTVDKRPLPLAFVTALEQILDPESDDTKARMAKAWPPAAALALPAGLRLRLIRAYVARGTDDTKYADRVAELAPDESPEISGLALATLEKQRPTEAGIKRLVDLLLVENRYSLALITLKRMRRAHPETGPVMWKLIADAMAPTTDAELTERSPATRLSRAIIELDPHLTGEQGEAHVSAMVRLWVKISPSPRALTLAIQFCASNPSKDATKLVVDEIAGARSSDATAMVRNWSFRKSPHVAAPLAALAETIWTASSPTYPRAVRLGLIDAIAGSENDGVLLAEILIRPKLRVVTEAGRALLARKQSLAPKAAELLAQRGLASDDSGTVSFSSRVLQSHLGDPAVLAQLRKVLRDEHFSRQAKLKALELVSLYGDLEAILLGLASPHDRVSRAAETRLAAIEEPSADLASSVFALAKDRRHFAKAERLCKAWVDGSPQNAVTLHTALARVVFAPQEPVDAPKVDADLARVALELLAPYVADSTGDPVAAVAGPVPALGKRAMEILADVKQPSAVSQSLVFAYAIDSGFTGEAASLIKSWIEAKGFTFAFPELWVAIARALHTEPPIRDQRRRAAALLELVPQARTEADFTVLMADCIPDPDEKISKSGETALLQSPPSNRTVQDLTLRLVSRLREPGGKKPPEKPEDRVIAHWASLPGAQGTSVRRLVANVAAANYNTCNWGDGTLYNVADLLLDYGDAKEPHHNALMASLYASLPASPNVGVRALAALQASGFLSRGAQERLIWYLRVETIYQLFMKQDALLLWSLDPLITFIVTNPDIAERSRNILLHYPEGRQLNATQQLNLARSAGENTHARAVLEGQKELADSAQRELAGQIVQGTPGLEDLATSRRLGDETVADLLATVRTQGADRAAHRYRAILLLGRGTYTSEGRKKEVVAALSAVLDPRATGSQSQNAAVAAALTRLGGASTATVSQIAILSQESAEFRQQSGSLTGYTRDSGTSFVDLAVRFPRPTHLVAAAMECVLSVIRGRDRTPTDADTADTVP